MSAPLVTIYGLYDPAAPRQVRYVGQTTEPHARLLYHIAEGERYRHNRQNGCPGDWRTRWLASVLEAGRRRALRTLARVRPENADAAELRHYLRCVLAGHDPTNGEVPGLGQSLPGLLRDYPLKRARRGVPPPVCHGKWMEALEVLAQSGYPGAQEALETIARGASCCDGPAGLRCTRLSEAQHRRRERTAQTLAEHIARAVATYRAAHGPVDDRTVALALLEAARLLS